MDWGKLHAVLKPLNFDIMYLSYQSANGNSQTTTGGNLMYRFGIGLGVNL